MVQSPDEKDGLIFKISTKQLKGLADFLQIAYETEICVDENGLGVVPISTDQVSGALVRIKKEFIKDLKGEAKFGIDTKKFNSIVSMLDEEEVEIWLENFSRLHFKEKKQELFLDIISAHVPEDLREKLKNGIKMKESAHFEIEATELNKTIRSAAKFELSHIKIVFDGEKGLFKLSLNKRIMGMEKELNTKKASGGKGSALFLVGALQDTLRGASGLIEIETKDEHPIVFRFKIENAEIESFVSPRIEDEGGSY